MRYAILSDIHGNLPAWNTVLSDLALRDVDRLLCLGDVVGYGPEPAEVLQSVYARVHLMVLGNHDAVVARRMTADLFTDRAQRMIAWTSDQLGTRAQDFFRDLPLVLKGRDFRCVHGDFTDPAAFNYIETADDAKACFSAVSETVLFCGHSHEAGLFVIGASGRPHALAEQDFSIEPGKRYLVNVGSVGASRGGDPRASYVIYDEEARTVQFIRVAYDFEAFRAAAARRNLGPDAIPMLRRAPSDTLQSVRDDLDFAPDGRPRVTDGVVENDVTMLLKKRMAVWKVAALAASMLGLATAAFAATIVLNAGVRPLAFPAERAGPVPRGAQPGADGNLLPPLAALTTGGFSAHPFRIVLGDSRHQHVDAVPMGNARAGVRLRSATSHAEAVFETPEMACRQGDRFEVIAKASFSDDFRGACVVRIKLRRGSEAEALTEQVVLVRNFVDQVGLRDENLPEALRGLPNAEGWWIARGTSDPVPSDARFVRVEIGGSFTGEVTLGGLSVRRR